MSTLFRSVGVSTADSYADDTFETCRTDMPLTPPSSTAARARMPSTHARSPSAAVPQLSSPQVRLCHHRQRQLTDECLSMAVPRVCRETLPDIRLSHHGDSLKA